MTFDLSRIARTDQPLPITADELERRIDELLSVQGPRLRRLWMYYRNPMLAPGIERDEQGSDRPYRQGQEWGLPSRITGMRCGNDPMLHHAVDGVARKEVVIENDIAWRIDTMVDFLFGQPIRIGSLSEDSSRREQIEELLTLVLEANGGKGFLQQLAMLGAVYGFVDVLVKFDPSRAADAPPVGSGGTDTPAAPPLEQLDSESTERAPALDGRLAQVARSIRLEIVEPARSLPILSETDWTHLHAYGVVYQVTREKPRRANLATTQGWISRVLSHLGARRTSDPSEEFMTVTELITSDRWVRLEDGTPVADGTNSLGQVPLVHIQNLSIPFQYAGTSDVEQLICLQDELNTRLSDRANRITMQSFKMYLGKGIEGFTDLPVAPGRMWMTDNDNADVIEFGGETSSPSEEAHITELREAMDKASGVSPVAAGAIRGRIGNLTSAAALRVTMMALLARTERKRSLYGDGLSKICALALAWLDRAGLFHSIPDERRVEIHWPPMLPDSESERLRDSQIKQSLGIPRETILRALGYADTSPSTPSPGTPAFGSEAQARRGEGGGEGSVQSPGPSQL